MLRPVGRNAASITLAVGIAWSTSITRSRADETDPDIGIVLASGGRPVIQDTSGRAGPSAVMQPIREDDVILFSAGDNVTICNEVLGSTFEISGPGTVRLTRSTIVSVTGSPSIRTAGACETSITGNTNGGVLLRKLTRGPGVLSNPAGGRPSARPE